MDEVHDEEAAVSVDSAINDVDDIWMLELSDDHRFLLETSDYGWLERSSFGEDFYGNDTLKRGLPRLIYLCDASVTNSLYHNVFADLLMRSE